MEPRTFLLDIDQDPMLVMLDQQTRVIIKNRQSEGWRHVETVCLGGRWQMVFRKL